eukprot:334868-Pleurochrysis_carterae.AAC.3
MADLVAASVRERVFAWCVGSTCAKQRQGTRAQGQEAHCRGELERASAVARARCRSAALACRARTCSQARGGFSAEATRLFRRAAALGVRDGALWQARAMQHSAEGRVKQARTDLPMHARGRTRARWRAFRRTHACVRPVPIR